MSIYRKHFNTKYFVAGNDMAEDRRISLRARGLLVYLLAKPDNWTVRGAKQIAEDIGADGEGVGAIGEALRELRFAGYYRVSRERREHGRFEMVTDVSVVANPEWAAEHAQDVADQIAAGKTPPGSLPVWIRGRMPVGCKPAGQTGTGFSDSGEIPGLGIPEPEVPVTVAPGPGNPGSGPPGSLVSNQSKQPEQVTLESNQEQVPKNAATTSPQDQPSLIPADDLPMRATGKYAVADEITRNWWERHKSAQSFLAVRGVIRTAVSNGVDLDRLSAALEVLAREGRPVSGGTLQTAMAPHRVKVLANRYAGTGQGAEHAQREAAWSW